jgi:hypothetical protein
MLHEQELRSADYARRMEEASEKKNGKRGK